MNEIREIKLEQIVPNRNQPRLDFYDESIEGLAQSIRENGLLQPVSVREREDGKYELIAGERRYRACLLNGFETVRAIVYEMDDDTSANLALIENIQREDLNAIEQAMAIERIMEKEDLTQAELAERLGYRQSTVANKLRLLKLPEYVKNAISRGEITERHARALLKVEPEKIEEVFMTIVNRHYNVAKTEEYIAALGKRKHRLGVSGSVKLAMNTMKQAYDMCRESGIDADYNVSEYDDSVKITIRIRK